VADAPRSRSSRSSPTEDAGLAGPSSPLRSTHGPFYRGRAFQGMPPRGGGWRTFNVMVGGIMFPKTEAPKLKDHGRWPRVFGPGPPLRTHHSPSWRSRGRRNRLTELLPAIQAATTGRRVGPVLTLPFPLVFFGAEKLDEAIIAALGPPPPSDGRWSAADRQEAGG